MTKEEETHYLFQDAGSQFITNIRGIDPKKHATKLQAVLFEDLLPAAELLLKAQFEEKELTKEETYALQQTVYYLGDLYKNAYGRSERD